MWYGGLTAHANYRLPFNVPSWWTQAISRRLLLFLEPACFLGYVIHASQTLLVSTVLLGSASR